MFTIPEAVKAIQAMIDDPNDELGHAITEILSSNTKRWDRYVVGKNEDFETESDKIEEFLSTVASEIEGIDVHEFDHHELIYDYDIHKFFIDNYDEVMEVADEFDVTSVCGSLDNAIDYATQLTYDRHETDKVQAELEDVVAQIEDMI